MHEVTIVARGVSTGTALLLLDYGPQYDEISLSVKNGNAAPLSNAMFRVGGSRHRYSWNLAESTVARLKWPGGFDLQISLQLSGRERQKIIVRLTPNVRQERHFPVPSLSIFQPRAYPHQSVAGPKARIVVTCLKLAQCNVEVYTATVRLEDVLVDRVTSIRLSHGIVRLRNLVVGALNVRTDTATIDARDVCVYRSNGMLALSSFSGDIFLIESAGHFIRITTGMHLLLDGSTEGSVPGAEPMDTKSRVVVKHIKMPARPERARSFVNPERQEAFINRLIDTRPLITITTRASLVVLGPQIIADKLVVESSDAGTIRGMRKWLRVDGEHTETQHIRTLEVVAPKGEIVPSAFAVERKASFESGKPLRVDLDCAVSDEAPPFELRVKVIDAAGAQGRSADSTNSIVRIWQGHIFPRKIELLEPTPSDISVEVEPA